MIGYYCINHFANFCNKNILIIGFHPKRLYHLTLTDEERHGLMSRKHAVVLDDHVFVGDHAVKLHVGSNVSILQQNAVLYHRSLTDMHVTVFGDGNGAEYTINETVFKPRSYRTDDPDYRIELSPRSAKKTDLIMSVMYVTDADNDSPVVKAEDISTDTLAGALILGRALLFNKSREQISGEVTFDIPRNAKCFVAGVKDGLWQISHNGTPFTECRASNGEGIICFDGKMGKITLKLL